MKAIQTKYNGNLFRSRLEARWAVFFDALRLTWDYEPEGFDLPGYGYYLPDFFIHEWKSWVEIKPRGGFHDGHGSARALANSIPDGQVILIVGNPWPGEHNIFLFPTIFPNASEPDDFSCFTEFAECRRCDGVCLLWQEHGDLLACSSIGPHTCEDHDKWPVTPVSAYQAARRARFEHGEQGRRQW